MKAWPSILSTDGVSIFIVVQEADIHSNQRCSIHCYNLASDDTRPSVTRVEGNVLQTWGGWEGHWFQKLGCALVPDRQKHSDSRVNTDFWKKKVIQAQKIDLKKHSLIRVTHSLPWTVGIGRIYSCFLTYFRVLFVLPLNGTAKVSLIVWFSLTQL